MEKLVLAEINGSPSECLLKKTFKGFKYPHTSVYAVVSDDDEQNIKLSRQLVEELQIPDPRVVPLCGSSDTCFEEFSQYENLVTHYRTFDFVSFFKRRQKLLEYKGPLLPVMFVDNCTKKWKWLDVLYPLGLMKTARQYQTGLIFSCKKDFPLPPTFYRYVDYVILPQKGKPLVWDRKKRRLTHW